MKELTERIKEHEGFRSTPYKCSAGKWTVGYGLNLESANFVEFFEIIQDYKNKELMIACGAGFSFSKETGKLEVDIEVSETLAEELLKQKLLDIKLSLVDKLPFFIELDETRQGVLIEMAYQMGISGLMGFENMLRALKRQDYMMASLEMLSSRWEKQTPRRAKKLSGIMRTNGST